MFELDGSETSWLVYADWLEDHDYDAISIREYVPTVNSWTYEFYRLGVGGKYHSFSHVGTSCFPDISVIDTVGGVNGQVGYYSGVGGGIGDICSFGFVGGENAENGFSS
jgi:hypothetical protein